MYALKEIAPGWMIYIGFLLAASLFLEFAFLKAGWKKILAVVIVASSVLGALLLTFSDVGLSFPLRDKYFLENAMTPVVEQGMEVYLRYGCPNCHTLNGWGTPAGPDLTGIVTRRSEEWTRQFLSNPSFRPVASVMPDYAAIPDIEMIKLLAFLSSLSSAAGPPPGN